MSDNLEEVITDSVDDALLPPEPVEESTELEASPDPTPDPVPESAQLEPQPEVKIEAQPQGQPTDDFEKKYGIPAQGTSGRENRIPYSRVVKITTKAAADARAQVTKEFETTHVPTTKYQELEATNKDYSERLTKVAELESVIMGDAPKFLDMLSTIPAYAKIFQELNARIAAAQAPAQAQAPVATPTPDPADEMPQPDQQLSDGSTVYSLEGLKALNAWNRAQARKEILKEVETTYGPLAKDYQQYQARQAVLPAVNQQIADAYTWPQFKENEAEIVKILEQYPKASLERAYQHVVWPKLQAEQDRLKKEVETKVGEAKINKDAVRAEVLAELKKAPRGTSVAQAASKPVQAAPSGPRSLEDIISESIQVLKK